MDLSNIISARIIKEKDDGGNIVMLMETIELGIVSYIVGILNGSNARELIRTPDYSLALQCFNEN
jgi:hypothetical protein